MRPSLVALLREHMRFVAAAMALLGGSGIAHAACVGISDKAIGARFAEARSACGARSTKATTSGSATVVQPRLDLPRSVAIGFPNTAPATAMKAQAVASRLGPNPHYSTVVEVARRYRIDPALLHAIVRQESGYRLTARSHKGALGLMQLMPATARGLGVKDVSQLTRDPVLNLSAGAAYLKQLQAQLGNNVPHVLAAYNAGPGAVRRYRGIPPYRETRGYVGSIMSSYGRTRSRVIR